MEEQVHRVSSAVGARPVHARLPGNTSKVGVDVIERETNYQEYTK